ncbi:MAG TPA: fused MFS/spermidine synthase [Bryobacteraceae bacterium]|jgi:SAM-dependent methyltransferase|nr:fused MFS/spermidine synthase [Bryobacteraceae bacterium]
MLERAGKLLFGCAIFSSSLLLFLIQPVFAKLILPWFGGSAAVWIVCLVFFQSALLAGYLYSHLLTSRLAPAPQSWIHIALLAASLFLLPVIPGAFWKPAQGSADPAWAILLLLIAVLGLPYFLLSTTTPLLQVWYTRKYAGPPPYRLFALSNAASLLALASYPFWIEPSLPTRAQASWWSGAFAVFAIVCALIAFSGRRSPAVEPRAAASRRSLSRSSAITWALLAAAGSMMLLATTNQLTQNVAAVPLLWILPLAFYLLSFVLCFESVRWYRRWLYLRLLALVIGSVGYAIYDIQTGEAIVIAVPIFVLGLFVCCMYCHGELSLRKPDAAGLTLFYLMIALGGAAGAIMIGLVAPHVFAGTYDLSFALLCVAALALALNWSGGWPQRLLWTTAVFATIFVFTSQVRGYHKEALVLMRSFYGSLRVVETSMNGAEVRKLYHGTVQHGSQYYAAGHRMTPTSYYGEDSGVGLAMRFAANGPKRAGMIGLGTGTLAAYGNPGDYFHFYEINPQVISIAGSLFSYTRETPARVEITPGDARLSLEAEPPQNFDVLVVDAFSGDAIPVHLLTREVFALYLRHLRPGGVLAVHVSNQYLDLAPIVREIAARYNLPAVLVRTPDDDDELLDAADWVLLSRNRSFLERKEVSGASAEIPLRPNLRMWTDDYNNLFQVLKLVRGDR